MEPKFVYSEERKSVLLDEIAKTTALVVKSSKTKELSEKLISLAEKRAKRFNHLYDFIRDRDNMSFFENEVERVKTDNIKSCVLNFYYVMAVYTADRRHSTIIDIELKKRGYKAIRELKGREGADALKSFIDEMDAIRLKSIESKCLAISKYIAKIVE